MNINLLIFALISLVILFPIMYFLPLKMSPKGKLIVIAVSFLISLTALFTKVFFQIWQSILLIIALLLLVTMIMKKKLTPLLYNMANQASATMDDSAPLKEDRSSDSFDYDYIPVMNAKEEHEGEKSASITPDLPEIQRNPEVNESSALQTEIIGQLEEIDPSAVGLSEDIPPQPVEESAQALEDIAAGTTVDAQRELDEISASQEQMNELDKAVEPENGVIEEKTYLAELEEMMMSEQMVDEDSKVDKDLEKPLESARFINELEELMKEVELSEDSLVTSYEQTASALEASPIMDDTEVISHDKEIESIEDTERTNTFIERTDTILENGEASEAENGQSQPLVIENSELDTSEHREVFQTILLQAEIAKKVLEPNQYEHFLQSHINYDRPAVECFTFASMLIEYYINNGNRDALLQLLGQLEENFSQFPILLQEIHYLQAHYNEK